jgi:small subunit ribosomal protein S8e
MVVWHGEQGRKPTGGEIVIARKKRKYELGNLPVHTKIGEPRISIIKTKGGGRKVRAFSVQFANVLDQRSKAVKKVKILDIVSNAANQHFTRRGIITKGSVIKTEIGNAKVTSRPSQHGTVNALMVEEKQ